MEERTLLKVSILLMTLGLGFLYFYSQEMELPLQNNIEQSTPQQKVRMEGIITQLQQHEKVFFLKVQGQRTETIDVIFFPQEEPFLHQGDRVEIWGQVEQYQGKKEIVADKVILTSSPLPPDVAAGAANT